MDGWMAERASEAAVNAPTNSQLSAAPERIQRLLLSGEESSRAINGQVGTEVSTQIGTWYRSRCMYWIVEWSIRRVRAAFFFTRQSSAEEGAARQHRRFGALCVVGRRRQM
eukprot:3675449-Prymnesium_polylepis.1